MKRKRILRSTPRFPQVVRGRRYYADLDHITWQGEVEREKKAREAGAAEADQATQITTTTDEEK
ncbi:hypothetical protein [Massilia sp. TN1-12]|uniref:hypothetical protein n=1 Tax=Massilia paldalensis TaxID=3377675 RepID=UPI00384EA294